MRINRQFRDFFSIYFPLDESEPPRRLFSGYPCSCSQRSWWKVTGRQFSEEENKENFRAVLLFVLFLYRTDFSWMSHVFLGKAQIRSTSVAKHVNKMNKTSWELWWIIMSLIQVWVITSSINCRQNTHLFVFSFSALEHILLFLPGENYTFTSQHNCDCVIFSPISLQRAAPACSQRQPGAAQSLGFGWVTVQIRPCDIYISGTIWDGTRKGRGSGGSSGSTQRDEAQKKRKNGNIQIPVPALIMYALHCHAYQHWLG